MFSFIDEMDPLPHFLQELELVLLFAVHLFDVFCVLSNDHLFSWVSKDQSGKMGGGCCGLGIKRGCKFKSQYGSNPLPLQPHFVPG